ncbi:uncharacterized protein LOC129244927 isoform X2 [Anastrepha obliqua]|uniref:uncharacterized protein LOC128868151 isoform X2 n=1 Tax=Anastrepha ludens TaxID=28586 RepID=UPI0023B06C8E|nr:uncharacterized protein LOC128868151 isoform X2 [Anastrepha ludens]XP_054738811.1 uncharacterized protein LOC129244927 isoform X2 [Anastrepha obliqua]
MDICGNVLVSKDVLNFALKCLYCETDIEEWAAFVSHIQSIHNTNYEEPCIDPLVELDYKEDIVVGLIKDEPMVPIPSAELAKNDDTMKMEAESDGELFKAEPGDDTASDVDQSQNNDAADFSSEADSSDDDENDKKDMIRNKKFNPTFYRRNVSTSVFIELYKNAQCLWDPNDEHYNNSAARENCQKEIIEEMKKRFQITLTNQTLRSCLRKLYIQYQATFHAKQKKSKSKSKKLPSVVLDYFDKCSFLSVAKDDFATIIEEAPNTNTNLSFAKLNPTTEAFIETYAHFPVLYDPKHEDYNNSAVRKQTYKEMSNIIKSKQNVEFTDDEIYKDRPI